MEISQSTLALLTAGIALLSALFGAAISSGVNLLVARLTRQSEERRQVRALVVQAALESWKLDSRGLRFDVFLLHMQKTSDVVFDPTTDPANLEERLKPIDKMVDIMRTRADRLRAEHEQKEQARRLALDQSFDPQQRIAD